jgi:hypothetical protein
MIDREKRLQVATSVLPQHRRNDPAFADTGDNVFAGGPTGESRPLAEQRQVLDPASETSTGHDPATRRPRVTTTGAIENIAPPSATGENGMAVSLR